MINIIFILSLIVLLFFLLKYNEKFINPKLFFKGNFTIGLMRKYRDCGKDIQCVLEKAPIIKYDNLEPPLFRKEVNYKLSQNIRHLFPQYKPTRVKPNT
tara:strand:+ start:28 stop:324 length:297 start_codon:yes stop_codon:yes gene_type:complete